jgi:predicted RNA binding protein with dsRBD fold (UPF0201 family)
MCFENAAAMNNQLRTGADKGLSHGNQTFLVYPEYSEYVREAKALTVSRGDAAVLFNLEPYKGAIFEAEQERLAKSVDVDLALDLDLVDYQDELLKTITKAKQTEEDERVEKSLLNSFPFNQFKNTGQNEEHHADHGDHGDHATQAEHHEDHHGDHASQADHHGDHHGDHHETQEEGEYSVVASSVDRSASSSPLRDQLSNRIRDSVRTQVRDQLVQRPATGGQSQLRQRFPFPGVASTFRQEDLTGDTEATEDSEDQNAVSFNEIREEANNDSEVQGGRKCIDKVMMVEVTEYTEIVTCDHSYDKRCHTSYKTSYDTQQEEECEENFIKVCHISYEPFAYNETVEICRTPLVKDCNTPSNETVCQTVYETECSTKQKVHEVEDDVTNCETQQMTKCEDVTVGYVTKPECDQWPVEVCTLKKELVKKYTPETACYKEPRELCAPRGCGYRNGAVECHAKIKTIVVDNPEETCEIEPQRVCKHVTKLVPRLVAVQECVEVPKEICARSSNPYKIKKPIIKKWCYVPSEESGLA